MKLDIVASSGNDEFYTPNYAIMPILKYVRTGTTIWCPFDTADSNFVKLLTQHGCNVIATHLTSDEDFFTMDKPDCDYIISNPPYSVKTEVLQRLFSLKTPFAMLIGVVGLFESQKRFEMFRDNTFEVMYLNRRVAYFKDFAEQKPSLNPPFSSVFLCSNMLPEQIVFEEVVKK